MENSLSYILCWIIECIYTSIEIDSQMDYVIIIDNIKDKFTLSEHEMNSLPIAQQKRILSSVLNLNYDFTSEQNFFEKDKFLSILMGCGVYIFRERIPFLTRSAQQRSNPPESSAYNQGQLLSQNMARANMGDQSISRHRPITRSMTCSLESPGLPNSGNNSVNN